MKSSLILPFAILATFLFAPNAFSKQECKDTYEVFENTQVETLESDNVCYISVHPRNSEHLLYRDFLFDTVGLFMVFDSYGEGPESQTTAARDFLFFPRKNPLSYLYNHVTKQIEVITPSGKTVYINAVKTILTGITGTTLNLNYEITPAARGGVEIATNDGLYLEGGFKIGQSPSQNPKNKIEFVDAARNRCQVYNADIYNYDSDQDANFKFNDLQLKSYMSSRCPNLKF